MRSIPWKHIAREPRWSLATIFLLLLVAVIPECAMATEPLPLPAKVALRLDFEGDRFCYDRDPEIIYSEYDRASGIARVMLQSLDGSTRMIANFPDVGGGADLACSQDGSTIAVLDVGGRNLYILRPAEMATYRFDNPLIYHARGTYSLLSPDGSMLSVPGAPIHVARPDV